MGIAVVGLIALAILALLAIPLIAAIVGRGVSDDDPNKTGHPEDDRNVEPKQSTGEADRDESERH